MARIFRGLGPWAVYAHGYLQAALRAGFRRSLYSLAEDARLTEWVLGLVHAIVRHRNPGVLRFHGCPVGTQRNIHRVPVLARKFHQPSAATRESLALAALRSIEVLNVLFKYASEYYVRGLLTSRALPARSLTRFASNVVKHAG